jgi:hypothetical protein
MMFLRFLNRTSQHINVHWRDVVLRCHLGEVEAVNLRDQVGVGGEEGGEFLDD